PRRGAAHRTSCPTASAAPFGRPAVPRLGPAIPRGPWRTGYGFATEEAQKGSLPPVTPAFLSVQRSGGPVWRVRLLDEPDSIGSQVSRPAGFLGAPPRRRSI